MKVLFLTCHLPYPPFSGGRRREYELIRRLGGEHEIELCAVTKTVAGDRPHVPRLLEHCATVRLFPATGGGTGAPQIARHRSPATRRHVQEALAGDWHDAVHVEGFYLMQHVPETCAAPLVLVEQNIEFELWRQRMDADAFRRTRTAEVAAWRRADLCAAVTEEDRRTMRRAAPGVDVRLVPDGADHSSLIDGEPRGAAALPSGDRPLVVMVGNYAYGPNLDAGLHLCDDVMPLLPGTDVMLVGSDPPAELLTAARRAGAHVTGRVPAVEPYLDAAAVVVCPLRIGGGVKVKMLEALARGKAIVTTSVGLQGLGPDARGAVCVGDDERELAAGVARLLGSPEARHRLERAAEGVARRLPSWDDAARALSRCWEDAARIVPARAA